MRRWVQNGSVALLVALLSNGCGGVPPPSAQEASAGQAASENSPRGEGLPSGFELSVYADGLGAARFMAFGPDGVLYVTSIRDGKVLALPDRNRDGKADETVVFAEGLRSPHGLAWWEGWLYVGETHRVVRLRDSGGDLRADTHEVIVPDLPPGEMHFTRTVGFGPDGMLYVSVGSSCNVCEERDARRAAILRYRPDGSAMQIYARGLRNAVGFAWHPETKELWATDNGRDWLGDDRPPEELNRVVEGGDYGWPYCYGNRVPDPQKGSSQRCARTEPAGFEMQAHSAPLGLGFYTGELFPEEYRGDLFIAFHGSWNRSVPTGYKVVRVRFRQGYPVGIENFVDVWYSRGRVQYRPVDVKAGPDGALYISTDKGQTIFRVTYQK